jgi:hypothetical protein
MPLPPCHSRRELGPGDTTYFCAHPSVVVQDGLVTAGICQICDFWKQPPPPAFRTYPLPAAKPRGPCVFLGEQTGLRDCKTCRGSVRVKVFACSHPRHQETTLSDCAVCPDFKAKPQEEAPTGPGG